MLDPSQNKSSKQQRYGLPNLIADLFSRKNFFSFVSDCSLESCITCVQKEQPKPSSERFGEWFILSPKFRVKVNQLPERAEFSIQIKRTGRYGFETKFHGYLEALGETSTVIRGESSQSGFSARIVMCVFMILWGLSTEKVLPFLFLTLGGLYLGPISNLLIKKDHLRYIESVFKCGDHGPMS
jgi:hypothetical protein